MTSEPESENSSQGGGTAGHHYRVRRLLRHHRRRSRVESPLPADLPGPRKPRDRIDFRVVNESKKVLFHPLEKGNGD